MCDTIGIMQPYFFPYIGYFQHVNACDKFVFLDDVDYANLEFVRRNNLLVSGRRQAFGLQMANRSQRTEIRHLQLHSDPGWRLKLLATIERSYRKAPCFDEVFQTVIRPVIECDVLMVAELNKRSIRKVCEFLGITTQIRTTSAIYQNRHLCGSARICDICKLEGASTYINPIGGIKLYGHAEFERNGLQLQFHKADMAAMKYSQGKAAWTSYLSIIDVLMWNEKSTVIGFLDCFNLVYGDSKVDVDESLSEVRGVVVA